MVKTIRVGKKLEPASTVQVPKPVRKKGLLSKMIEVIKEDMDKSNRNIRAILDDPPEGWDEYRAFVAQAKGDRYGEKE
jgi:hypothetical protein